MAKKTKSFDPKFLKAAVYGANDGIITSFAVVAGVAGAGLAPEIVIVLGIANLVADGASMGIGDYLGERSEQTLRKNNGEKVSMHRLWQTGLVTFIAFTIAGTMPLVPYIGEYLLHFTITLDQQFIASFLATALSLFIVGSLRNIFTKCGIIRSGLEMLSIGIIAALIAFFIGAWAESWVKGI